MNVSIKRKSDLKTVKKSLEEKRNENREMENNTQELKIFSWDVQVLMQSFRSACKYEFVFSYRLCLSLEYKIRA